MDVEAAELAEPMHIKGSLALGQREDASVNGYTMLLILEAEPPHDAIALWTSGGIIVPIGIPSPVSWKWDDVEPHRFREATSNPVSAPCGAVYDQGPVGVELQQELVDQGLVSPIARPRDD